MQQPAGRRVATGDAAGAGARLSAARARQRGKGGGGKDSGAEEAWGKVARILSRSLGSERKYKIYMSTSVSTVLLCLKATCTLQHSPDIFLR